MSYGSKTVGEIRRNKSEDKDMQHVLIIFFHIPYTVLVMLFLEDFSLDYGGVVPFTIAAETAVQFELSEIVENTLAE